MNTNTMKVVLVNDDETDLGALSRIFEEQGFSVKVVQRGSEEELRDFEGLVVKRVGRKGFSLGSKAIKGGNIEIDPVRCEAKKAGKRLDLTMREFSLLACLMKGKGKVFSREKLLIEVWGSEYQGDVRTVDVTVRRLREKVEDHPSEPKYIKTRRSFGYYFEPKK